MAKITASDVKKLRELTGAGMMDCKNSLTEAEGDFDKAIDVLRKKGQKIAGKRADRDSSEGASIALVNEAKTKGISILLGCETDFVAKNDSFVEMATKVATIALEVSTKEELLAADFEGMTIAEKMIEQTGVIGEKIELKSFEVLEAAFVGSYIHNGNGISTLVGLSAAVEGADVVSRDIAMQAAAMNPVALDETSISTEAIAKEEEIAKDLLRQEGKPEAMIEKIVIGKVKKFFKENTLVNQAFIKDNKMTVAKYAQTLGKDITIVGFKRVAIG
ncbi:MAG: elongation factor Ts [Flavobacteriaceae bacterium]|nr:elongation factor Ts [Flavobacteriaceae bacterium]